LNSHPSDPYDISFKAELNAIHPNLADDLGQVAGLSEQIGERVMEAILHRGCQAQNERNITLGRMAAAETPHDWFVEHVERTAARVLNLDDDWDYLRLLEMCENIDTELLKRLVARGSTSPDAGVREAAADFAK